MQRWMVCLGIDLLGVWPNALDVEGVTLNCEIKAPILVDTPLPEVVPFIELLGVNAGMAKVTDQESELFYESFLHFRGSHCQSFDGSLRKLDVHRVLAGLLEARRRL